jgi:hypothetical protein
MHACFQAVDPRIEHIYICICKYIHIYICVYITCTQTHACMFSGRWPTYRACYGFFDRNEWKAGGSSQGMYKAYMHACMQYKYIQNAFFPLCVWNSRLKQRYRGMYDAYVHTLCIHTHTNTNTYYLHRLYVWHSRLKQRYRGMYGAQVHMYMYTDKHILICIDLLVPVKHKTQSTKPNSWSSSIHNIHTSVHTYTHTYQARQVDYTQQQNQGAGAAAYITYMHT